MYSPNTFAFEKHGVDNNRKATTIENSNTEEMRPLFFQKKDPY